MWGNKIGCGGHLSALKRTEIGDYRLESAFTVKEIEEFFS
jgi:tRNA U55 pseudouridine synthase TruB